jgi:hypothetical protein
MRYTLLICQDETAAIGADERLTRFAASNEFMTEMRSRGILLDGIRLKPTSTATTVKVRNGSVVIADGPFAETKEQIAGLLLVDCKDLDAAIEVASQWPIINSQTVEVRPVWEF